MEVEMLVIGDPGGNAAIVAALRCEENRTSVDAVILPDNLRLVADTDELPQHPMVLLRTFSNVQAITDPDILRIAGGWLMDAADQLKRHLDEGT